MRILPTSPNPKPTMSNPDPPSPAPDHPPTISSPKQPSSSRARLLKIPPIAFRGISKDDNDGEDDDDKASKFKDKYRDNNGDEEDDDSTPLIMASNLGLNNIRTRSSLSPLPLSTPTTAPVNHGSDSSKVKSTVESRPKPKFSDEGKRVQWHSKSLRNPSPRYPVLEGNHGAFGKEMHSPRFQAILCVTSGRKKGGPDIKSFSHELNSKGVRPFPVWKSRALGHMEEIMVAVREKFDRLKEEVNSDLGAFAGDLVGLLENTSEPHPEWRESLEDLLIVARHCAKMRPSEFWFKCEGIVQNLDDRRQELTVGVLKQAHTRLLFILTRCTRLVQFQKESGYEEERILGLHQLSDLGVYPDQILEAVQQNICGPPSGKDVKEKHMEKPHKEEQGHATDIIGLNTAKSLDSSSGSCKMSSWKKLPCASGKKKKGSKSTDTQSSEKSDPMHGKDEAKSGSDYNVECMEIPPCHPVHSEAAGRVPIESSANWGYHPNVHCESLMICRICEVEIPTVHVEEHSRICTIVDRCDLKGLTVNERLDRVAETLKKIMEYWTPRSTPKGSDVPQGSFDAARVPVTCTHEAVDESPKRNNCYNRCPKDMLTCVPDANNVFLNDDLNVFPDMSCEAHSTLVHDSSTKSSSDRSLTPRSPLLTPRTSQIELLLSGCRIISELESYQQIQKLLDIVRSVTNINNYDYSALECMLERIGELKYAIQDRKVDALIVETFGRRIEKLLQEKYVHLCGQIEDERVDSLNGMADEESSVEEDTVRSLRASPINVRTRDRTSIEDFEIIKPISRGAFGRVFLAKKRSTGDSFAIKVLKKADIIRKNAVESILAERNILISVRNPFVVRFFYSFTCRENLYLVMEYLNGGDLYSLLRNVGSLDEDVTRVYIAEVVLALEYLHSVNIIHRDLKPDNLVIGQDGHVKLTDFGLSKVGLINSTDDFSGPLISVSTFLGDDDAKSRHSSKREQRQKHSVVGTPDYLAPEILLGTGHGAAADWWSVGVILYELLVGVPPFNAEHPQQIFNNIINRDISWPKVPEEISYEAYDLINKLLTENPGQRLGTTGSMEVKQHSFFRDINWDTLEQQKAMFIPSADALDTSYFESRYIWNPEDEHVNGGSDFDDMTDTCSSGSYVHDEDGDECGSLADFNPPTLAVQYSFSNFSFKNLSQLASINYDMVVKSAMESPNVPKPAIP